VITLCGFGVSNYYNKLKFVMLEKNVPFQERLMYPWQREAFRASSPLGKIPYIETEHGSISESQVILEYLEDQFPDRPMYPTAPFERARCRELIQHLELNCEWVARRLYKECFFGGTVSLETKADVLERLVTGLAAVSSLSSFSPYILGPTLTAADCVAFVHFTMISQATRTIYGEDLLNQHVPKSAAYMTLLGKRESVVAITAGRSAALEAFLALNVKYDG